MKKQNKEKIKIVNSIIITVVIITIIIHWVNVIHNEYPQCVGDLHPTAYNEPLCTQKEYNTIAFGTIMFLNIFMLNTFYQIIYVINYIKLQKKTEQTQ